MSLQIINVHQNSDLTGHTLFIHTICTAAAAAKSLQSCPTLSDPMDCSLPGFSVHGIFQARVLELGAIALLPYLNFQTIACIQTNILPFIQIKVITFFYKEVSSVTECTSPKCLSNILSSYRAVIAQSGHILIDRQNKVNQYPADTM